jgi:hypothetical protein
MLTYWFVGRLSVIISCKLIHLHLINCPLAKIFNERIPFLWQGMLCERTWWTQV